MRLSSDTGEELMQHLPVCFLKPYTEPKTSRGLLSPPMHGIVYQLP